MSLLLRHISTTEDFISEENFTLIRNDLRRILKPVVLRNVDDEDYIDQLNPAKIEENKTRCLEAIESKEDSLKTKFDHYEAIVYLPLIPGWLGIIPKMLSWTTSEGSSIQRKIFEKASFGKEDNPDTDELIYRDVWNKQLVDTSFVNSIVIVSFFLEASPKFYDKFMNSMTIQAENPELSRLDLAKRVYSEVWS